MLLTLVIVSVIALAVQGVVRSGIASQRRTASMLESDQSVGELVRRLGRDLRHVRLQIPGASGVLVGVGADGNAGLLRISTNCSYGDIAGEQVYYYLMPPEGDKPAMLLRRSRRASALWNADFPMPASGGNDRGDSRSGKAAYEVLLSRVDSFSLRFYDGLEWTGRWNSADKGSLPRLVELNISMTGQWGDQYSYPRTLSIPIEGILISSGQGAEQ